MKIFTTQNALERSIQGIKRIDKIKIKVIKNKLKRNLNVKFCIRRIKWDWAGHLASMKDNR